MCRLSAVLVVAFTLESAISLNSVNDDGLDWWQSATFYQIYPRSFMDSDADGIGDLRGIIDRLDHLKDAGVTATWLSPIFKSPQVDQGYDISDYRTIDPIFGTVEDFRNLTARARELGIKIILDFVPNHTSNLHEWFIKSENRTEGYEDFYIWLDGIPSSDSDRPAVPNNWISAFKGSAWEWSEKRQQYYYHQFAPQQPDLNYSNPKVVQEMKDVLKYWMDQGADGFRIDAVPYLFEDPLFKDEPLAFGYSVYDPNNADCLDHIYIRDLEKTFEMIYQFRDVVDEYAEEHKTETKVLMTEAYSPIEKQVLFYGTADGSRKGAHFAFNFNFITDLTKNFNIDDIANSINIWLSYIPKQYTSNWVLGNHDNHRVATRLGKDNVDGFNMLIAILPGVMVTYNGEEIGMEDGEVTCEQGFDPQAIKNCSTFDEISRDFERTPFQWDSSKNAGFSDAEQTWLPVSENAKFVNLAAQNVPGLSSHYNVYKDLMKFRKNFANRVDYDTLGVIKLSEELLQVVRRRDAREFTLLFNVGDSKEEVEFFRTKESYEVVIASVNSTYAKGDKVDKLVLGPHESLIIQSSV